MLGNDKLREDATACLMAAISAVEPASLVSEFLTGATLGGARIRLAAIGKAAGTMATGAYDVLGSRLLEGVLIVPEGVIAPEIPGVSVYHGGHPIPNEEGQRGAKAVLDLATGLTVEDVLVCLISGGGSALMTLPPDGVSLSDVRTTTDRLLRAGATIHELNCVRKHLDRLKGGRLARLAAPARVYGLVLSDVCGDPLDVIASGPLSPDPTTYDGAVRILTARGLWADVPESVRRHLTSGMEGLIEETPGTGDTAFATVEVHIIGSNRIAAGAVRREAEARGYRTRLLTTELTGEAREVGRVLGSIGREMQRSGEPLSAPGCIVAAGETTVTVRGHGKGGRNQELALGAALEIQGVPLLAIGSIGTDGIDGPTDAAGALVDGSTIATALTRGLDPALALENNDAYTILGGVGHLIVTGPTGTNVMDVQVVMLAEHIESAGHSS